MAEAIVNTTGEDNVEHDYSQKLADDCLSNKVMAEISRRLQSNVAFNDGGQVVFAPDPPNSKERIWIEKNSTGGIIGTVKRYESSTSEWVDDHYHPGGEVKPFDNTVINRVVQKYDPVSVQAISQDVFTSIIGSTYNYTPRQADSFIEYRFYGSAAAIIGGGTQAEMAGEFKMTVDGIEQPLSTKPNLFGNDTYNGVGTINYSYIIDSWGESPGFIELTAKSTSNFFPFNMHESWNAELSQAGITITEYGR